MKKVFLFTLLTFFGVIGYEAWTYSTGPLPGKTGAPGEVTCVSCHTTGAGLNQGPEELQIAVVGNPSAYVPGQTYTIHVSWVPDSRFTHGFEMVALNASGMNAGNWILTDPDNVQQVSGTINGSLRHYVEHTLQGNGLTSWNIDWVAPATGAGAVTFYLAGNAANSDGDNTGDNIYTETLILSEGSATPNTLNCNFNGTAYCAGTTLPISIAAPNTVFNTGNVFTAQLSDASGSFAVPVNIGTRNSNKIGLLNAKLPASAMGAGYRIRVISSNPSIIGHDNGANLTILAAPATVTTTPGYICGSSGSTTLTVSGGGTGITGYNWYEAATGGTAVFTGNSFTTPVLTASKIYYVAAVNPNGCESPVRKTAKATVTSPFPISVTPSAPTILPGNSVSLTVTASETGVTYKWSPSTGLNTTTGATVTATPSTTTTYTVTGTKSTCTSTTTVTVNVNCPSSLSGNYTINKNQPVSASNFTSLRSFAQRINNCGVSGPVVATIAAGTGPYAEQVEFGVIQGASAVRTITLNGNGNTLQFAPTSAANYVLRLNGTDYLRLNNLVLSNTSATIGYGVHLYNGAEHNIISSCTINSSTTATGSALNGIVASAATTSAVTAGVTVTDLQLLNNTITGGYYGISLCSNATAKATGVVLTGNTLTNAYYAGAYLFNLDAPQVSANTITMRAAGSLNGYGLYLSSVDNGFMVQKNKITGFGRYGLNLTNCNSTAVTVRAQVSNNMIGGGVLNSTAATYGLYLNNADRVDVWHNSVNLDQGFTSSAAFYALASAAALDVRNNSFAFTGTSAAYAFYAPSTSLTTLDYNNYFSTGSKFAYLSADKADLAALQSVATPAGHDVHSYQGNPMYISSTNLHVQAASTQLANRGVANAAMNSDIDGNARATSPDLGADEYASPARMMSMGANVSIAASAYPNPVPAGANLQVSVTAHQAGQVQYRLSDLVGRVVLNMARQVEYGTSVQTLDMSKVSKGLYILAIQQGDQSTQVKIMKE